MSQAFTFTLPDGRLMGYSSYGAKDGLPILLFHGTPGSRLFGMDHNSVSAKKLCIVCPERPGYGLSPKSPRATLSSWADDVAALTQALKIQRFHVIGISGGGPFALACAALLPQRVISATLIASVAPMETPGFWIGLNTPNRLLFAAARYARWLLPTASQVVAWLTSAGDKTEHMKEALRQGRAGIQSDLRLLTNRWDIPLESIVAPVFVWHGEKDSNASPSGIKRLTASLPSAEWNPVRHAGHFLGRDAKIMEGVLARIQRASFTSIND
jgi:pimeloyl-ACP methyl ester carboxylesterase